MPRSPNLREASSSVFKPNGPTGAKFSLADFDAHGPISQPDSHQPHGEARPRRCAGRGASAVSGIQVAAFSRREISSRPYLPGGVAGYFVMDRQSAGARRVDQIRPSQHFHRRSSV